MGDTQFHYRVRCSGEGAGGTGLRYIHQHQGAPLVLMVCRATVVRVLLGFSLNREFVNSTFF